MDGTGRLKGALDPRVQRLLYGNVDALIDAELEPATRVDLAHVVMLAETGLLDERAAARLVAAIRDLRASGFAELRAQTVRRGLYLHVERYLIERLGEQDAGSLQLGRSRNDLNATVVLLRLRRPLLALLSEALRLLAALIGRARRDGAAIMPGYTHYQPAQPITFAHYALGVGFAVARDVEGVLDASKHIDRSPLGAGALAGTTLPIDPGLSARLLGFSATHANSLDAVATRDVVLRLLAAATIFGVTLSRAATDLLLWSTQEIGFVRFPDALSGSSSMMPQKRNAFTLEHVQGRASAALGAFCSATAAMTAKPFTNSVAVGTEGVTPVWEALTRTTEAAFLMRLAILQAELCPDAMREKSERGYVTATAFADRLVRGGWSSFREAHHAIGTLVGESLARGGVPLAEMAPFEQLGDLSAEAVVRNAEYGGGPGTRSSALALEELSVQWRQLVSRRAVMDQRWETASVLLDRAVAHLIDAGGARGDAA